MSFPYYYGELIFAIPQGRPYTSLEKLFFPFRYRIWICLSALLFSTVLVTFGLKFMSKNVRDFVIGSKINAPLCNAINICFGNAIAKLPQRNFARTLLFFWLLTWMVLRNAYQGTLFSYLHSEQRMPTLFHLDEVIESDVKIYLLETFYQIFHDNYPPIRHR